MLAFNKYCFLTWDRSNLAMAAEWDAARSSYLRLKMSKSSLVASNVLRSVPYMRLRLSPGPSDDKSSCGMGNGLLIGYI